MKLIKVGPSSTVVRFANGDEIFFSYSTPVAGKNSDGLFKTEQHWSMTTSKHINKYLRDQCHANPDTTRTVPQESIDLFAGMVKSVDE